MMMTNVKTKRKEKAEKKVTLSIGTMGMNMMMTKLKNKLSTQNTLPKKLWRHFLSQMMVSILSGFLSKRFRMLPVLNVSFVLIMRRLTLFSKAR
ncbi:unnamed protein product [Cuscuta campestris]|uniref:Uncharacterized protein n=1 Tax=Cuscuta campestris TaxID=132261 RepID=A0A484KPH4_9ASTE|nr:unnamed protein product [Cuscuta campestris]VFQ63976.1 unnamed protein product [Cuscuta campestris]